MPVASRVELGNTGHVVILHGPTRDGELYFTVESRDGRVAFKNPGVAELGLPVESVVDCIESEVYRVTWKGGSSSYSIVVDLANKEVLASGAASDAIPFQLRQ